LQKGGWFSKDRGGLVFGQEGGLKEDARTRDMFRDGRWRHWEGERAVRWETGKNKGKTVLKTSIIMPLRENELKTEKKGKTRR